MHAPRMPFPHTMWIRASAYTSVLVTVLGTMSFIAGSSAHHDQVSSLLGTCLIFTLPACALFLASMFRLRLGYVLGAALVSIVGGLVMLAAAIWAAISSAYANPCFEIAQCTKGPTFSYVAFLAAMTAFLVAAALGLFISPTVMGAAAHRRSAAI